MTIEFTLPPQDFDTENQYGKPDYQLPTELAPTVISFPEKNRAVSRELHADVFEHWQGNEDTPGSEECLPIAWSTHAQGYLRTGLATEAAIGNDGYLLPVIDKSRHLAEGVMYYIGQSRTNLAERSTARTIDSPTVEGLPTYALTGDGIYPAAADHMKQLATEGYVFREVGALANALPGYSPGSEEIMRNMLVGAVNPNSKSKTLLFYSMVEPVRLGMAAMLSPRNVRPIGESVVLAKNQFRKETVLTPVIIEPDQFLHNIVAAYQDSKREPERRRYIQRALFFAAKLPDRIIPREVIQWQQAESLNVA